MTNIGTLSGVGKLWDGSKDLGPVDYEIQVLETGTARRGEGTLHSARYGLWDGFQAGKSLMLMVRSGEQLSLTVKSLIPEGVEISATGPIPAPMKGLESDD